MKYAVITSTEFQKFSLIYDELNKLYHYNSTQHIIGSAANGPGDAIIRKSTIEKGVEYIEFNPSYTGYNPYSYEQREYYGKRWHLSHLHDRYKKLFIWCDEIIVFISDVAEKDKILIECLRKTKKPISVLK